MNVFSEKNPELRLVWDATTLAAFMCDPLSYYWKYVQGYRSLEPSIDLLWGTAWDKSMAHYHLARSRVDRLQAIESTVAFAIAHAKKVGLDAVAAENKRKHNKKNLSTLIRSIVWYDDEHGDYEFYKPVFENPTQLCRHLVDDYYVVGNFDQIVRDRNTGKRLVVERKSTDVCIGQRYWQTYDPSVQVNVYDWLLSVEHNTQGVLLEAVQTAVGFSRFDYHTVYRTAEQRNHWESVMRYYIGLASDLAASGDWKVAMNIGAQRWESVTRDIQRRTPMVWSGMLETEMVKRPIWDPQNID